MDDDDTDLPLAHQAAANGDLSTLSRAIQADPAVLEHQDVDGVTPLGHAVISEQLDAAKLLVKMGASINTQDNLGRTCLSLAAYQEYTPLRSAGSVTGFGDPAWDHCDPASQHHPGWYEGVKFLLRNGASQNVCDKSGRTPLHSATYATDREVIQLLLQNMGGVSINQLDDEGMAPLHWAAFHNRPSHIELLLGRGATVSLQDVDGKSALHWAAQNGGHECCATLLSTVGGHDLLNSVDNSEKTSLHLAAAAGHPTVIRILAETKECMVDIVDPDERTPLHWAAAMGKEEAVATLLQYGVDPSPADIEGSTPLDYAKQSDHQDCVDILEERLGIRKAATNNNPSAARSGPDLYVPPRKNRLGFLSEFFRSKKEKESACIQSGNVHELAPNSDCRRNSEVSIHFKAGSKQADNPGTNQRRVSLPKTYEETDEIDSIKRLQISREDNPALGLQLGKELPPVGALYDRHLQKQLPRSDVLSSDRSQLIRSPPPMYHRDRSISPVRGSGPLALRSEANRAQLKEDAAQILALHPHHAHGKTTINPSQGSVSPRQLDPITSPRGSFSNPDQGLSPRLDISDLDGQSLPPTKHGLSQLAPIKGPLPKMSGPTINKRLHLLRQERSGANRSPTPPSWDYGKQNILPSGILPVGGESSTVCESGPSQPYHKKKKKKKSKMLRDRHDQDAPNGHLVPRYGNDREDDDETGEGSRLQNLTPRLGNKHPTVTTKGRDKKEQRSFNRDIHTLLQ